MDNNHSVLGINRPLSQGDLGLSTGRPSKGRPAKGQRGFTLVEMMVAFALTGLSALLAFSSFDQAAEKRVLSNGAEQLVAFIKSAQVESIHRNQLVTISYSRTSNSNWCVGAVLGTTACDCTETTPSESDFCAIDSAPRIFAGSDINGRDLMQSMTGDGAYSFDAVRGLFINMNDSLSLELQSKSGDFKLDLTVRNTGQVTLCSKDEEHAVPGYQVCA